MIQANGLTTAAQQGSQPGGAPPSVALAIVGLSCLFPKAESAEVFWSNVARGVDCIAEIPETHWDPEHYFHADPKSPDMTYARRGGFLDPVPFNPIEFGISPNNLEAIDTAQLLGLVAAKRALEHAGYGGKREFDRTRVGCILGVTGTLELVIPLGARLGHPHWRKALKDAGVPQEVADDVVQRISDSYVPWQENSFPGLLGNVVAGRIANKLDLLGTNCVVDAACASSLSALHLAALELTSGRSDMVLTGGVDTFNDIFMYMCFSKTPALSATGDARPFSTSADGTILGEGIGVVVLKRLADARRDGDRVYAVIRGVGTSSDGKGTAVYAPKADGQIRCLKTAYQLAGVDPRTVELVEAHGTGTRVGDATEVSGLAEVFNSPLDNNELNKGSEPREPWCAIGSVKSQIGHTKAAAGIASLIKATMALHHRVLPPTIKVDQPVETFLKAGSPFYVSQVARPWLPRPDHPRRAGVSAFGFGGSNFHCVLEEAPNDDAQPHAPAWDGQTQLVTLSAGSAADLQKALGDWTGLADWRAVRAKAALARKQFSAKHPFRLSFVLDRSRPDWTQLAAKAADLLQKNADTPWQTPDGIAFGRGGRAGSLGMLFPGQGSQYPHMLRDWACLFPEMQETLAEANVAWRQFAGRDDVRLSDVVYPLPAWDDATRQRQADALRATQTAQPALGAVSLGALRVLRRFGAKADAYAGHSYGELTALCASGRFVPQSLYRLSMLRGRLMASAGDDAGGMLAVTASAKAVREALAEHAFDLVIANHNSPTQVVLSGRRAEIDRAAEAFARKNIRGKKLAVSAAFHSPLVATASRTFRPALDEVEFRAADTPVYANTSAELYPSDAAAARDLLANQLARSVNFVDEIENMYAAGVRTFLEVGPGNVLTGLVGSILSGRDHRTIALDASHGKRTAQADLALALGQLAAQGYELDLTAFDAGGDFRLPDGPVLPASAVVPIGGANYRKPTTPRPPREPWTPATPPAPAAAAPAAPPAPAPVEPAAVESAPATFAPTTAIPSPVAAAEPTPPRPAQPLAPEEAAVTEPDRTDRPARLDRNDRWEQIQNNLAALQRMQAETAKLHREFLQQQGQALELFERLAQEHFDAGAVGDVGADASEDEDRGLTPPARQEEEATVTVPAAPLQAAVHEIISALVEAEATPSSVDLLGGDDEPSAVVGQAPACQLAPAVEPDSSGVSSDAEHLGRREPALRETAPADVPSVADASSEMAQLLLAVVGEKTGYPAEILQVGMSLDHDLGIDSIKRVEILSALQERIPSLPSVTPEQLTNLHTLEDVLKLLPSSGATKSGAGGSEDHAVASVATEEGAASSGVESLGRREPALQEKTLADASGSDGASTEVDGAMAGIVLAVVAEKTGYPAEILQLGMNLDHDLGIDSIKRVEILSAMQERIPALPAVTPEQLANLHTLEDVVALLRASGAGAAMNESVAAQVPTLPHAEQVEHVVEEAAGEADAATAGVLLQTVAEKTGYPAEILQLGMSLDHDLGIDSIKRVEILSALQERIPSLPEVTPEQLANLHTLEDVLKLLPAPSEPRASATGLRDAVPEEKTLADASSSKEAAASGVEPHGRREPALQEKTLADASGSDGGDTETDGAMTETLLATVAEKTGYPAEILQLGMSLDHDLGIDSIKRVEILSALQERLPSLPAVTPEQLANLHTLEDVLALLAQAGGSASHPFGPSAPVAEESTAEALPQPQPPLDRLVCRAVQATHLDPNVPRPAVKLAAGAEIWITDDGSELSLRIARRLSDRGHKPRIVALDQPQQYPLPPKLGGLVVVAPQAGLDESGAWQALQWLQYAGPALRKTAAADGAVFATVSLLDGCFGFDPARPLTAPLSGALAGLAKTASLEWPELECKAIDVDDEWDAPARAAELVVDELLHVGPIEVGLREKGRVALQETAVGLSSNAEPAQVIRPGELVVVTGGARGVTAETAVALARTFRPTVALWGRHPQPEAEPNWLAGCETDAAIKRAIVQRGAATTPRAIEQQTRDVLANREITRTLERLKALGVEAVYQSVDVRHYESVSRALGQVQKKYGPVRGLVHGAGVLADGRIENKTAEQFRLVYQTKVQGLQHLLASLAREELRFVGLFSSYTGRYGRVGQVDYAMANEALNKLGQQLARERPACRVASFNWGPWDGGMVTPALRQIFAAEGVGLIPLDQGSELVAREFCRTERRPVELVVLAEDEPGDDDPVPTPPSSDEASPPVVDVAPSRGAATSEAVSAGPMPTLDVSGQGNAERPAFHRTLSVAQDRYLASHVIGGAAVLPMAMSLEWLAHGAMHHHPGLELAAVRDLRVLRGVKVAAAESLDVRVMTGRALRQEGRFFIPTKLVSQAGEREVLHVTAQVELSDVPINPPDAKLAAVPESLAGGEDWYAEKLFHGPLFRAIRSVEGLSEAGITVVAAATPAPQAWTEHPLRNRWLTDPLAVDAVFQALILWGWRAHGKASLPCYVGLYERYRHYVHADTLRVVVRVTRSTGQTVRADAELHDGRTGQLVARLENVEMILDAQLADRFRQRTLAD